LKGVTEVKPSFFNLYLSDEKGETFVIFNALTKAAIKLDKKSKEAIENGKFDSMEGGILEKLKEQGIVAESEIEEMRKFKVLYESTKFNKKKLGFGIVPTYKCNMACTYCYQGKKDALAETMSGETVQSILKFIKRRLKEENADQLILHFYGGEPLLEFRKIAVFLKELKNSITSSLITTNGSLVTKEVVNELKKYPTVLEVTLAGPEEIHDKKRAFKNGTGTYRKIIQGLSLAVENGVSVVLRIDVDEENKLCFDELLTDLSKHGFHEFIPLSFRAVAPIAHAMSYPLCLKNKTDLVKLYKKAVEKGFRVIPEGPNTPFSFCQQQTSGFMMIDLMGDIYCCEGILGARDQRAGSIDKQGNLKIEYPYFDWLARDPLQIDKCRSCKALPICCGGCAFIAYLENGTCHAPACFWGGNPEYLEIFIKYQLYYNNPQKWSFLIE
jgi:uncharacterized protein